MKKRKQILIEEEEDEESKYTKSIKLNKIKSVEYTIPFLPPCSSCGRCESEPRQRQETWEWLSSEKDLKETKLKYLNGPKPVEIVDARSEDAQEKYERAILLGEPIVLTGPKTKCLTEFATPWFQNGVFNVEEFCKSVGDAKGPIARDGYTGSQLEEGEIMKVADYMHKYWPYRNQTENCPYLAQWEFSAAVIDADEESNDNNNMDEEETGMRSLHWKLSTVPVEIVGTDFFSVNRVLNPYQYLFIGGPGTSSKVHNDLGGMTIFIVGMVGEKSVTLIHRDDESLMYGLEARKNGSMSREDMDNTPLASMVRSWHHVITPGDVLVMPPRTIHAVENLTECISYSRCHLGHLEIAEWLRSYTVFDTPNMNHELVIYEASNEFIKRCKRPDNFQLTRDEINSLKALRDGCRVLASRNNGEEDQVEAIGAWISLGNELDKLLPISLQKSIQNSTIEIIENGQVKIENDGERKRKQEITPGDTVSLFPDIAIGKRANKRAVVVNIHKRAYVARVKFVENSDSPSSSELVLRKSIRAIPDKKKGTPKLACGVKAMVAWNTGEQFEAILVEDPSDEPIDVLEIQFNLLGPEWNQLVTVKDIAHVTSGFKIEL